MQRLTIFILFTLYLATVSAQYPLVNNNRPRIWVSEDRLQYLKGRIGTEGDIQSTYDEIDYAYEHFWITEPELYLVGSDSTQWTWTWSSGYAQTQALLSIFLFKMTEQDLMLRRCRFIARQAIEQMNTTEYSALSWYEKEDLFRSMSNHGILLDQCYNYFPSALRDSLVQSFFRVTALFMSEYIQSGAGASYVSSHNTWNTIICNQNILALYNAEALSSAQKDSVNAWYQLVYDKIEQGFMPCWTYYRDDDGAWNWGAAYSMWSLIDQIQLFENMKIGTDKNFFTDLEWLPNSVNQYWYFMRPDNQCIHWGDGQTFLAGDRFMYLHARYYNDPRSQYLVQHYTQDAFMAWTEVRFNKIIYKDFDSPHVEHPNLPLDWWGDKVGLMVSRSSWDSSATLLTFYNAHSKKAAHEHRDNNSFTIFKNKPLLLDAGSYDFYASSHYRHYYQRTIAHNSICVFDSADIYTYNGDTVANDGGQIDSDYLDTYDDIFLPENQRGKWLQWASSSNYAYAVADAQLSYDSAKLSLFRRRLLYLRPNRLLLLDHVVLKHIGERQRALKWLAHFPEKPTMSGDMLSATVPNHIETYQGTSYFVKNGNGTLAIKTLLPDSSRAQLIGGENYEYWVNGNNYPPQENSDDIAPFSPGKWRIEVSPSSLSDTVVYLHSFGVGDSVNQAEAGGWALQTNVSVGADWNDTIYFFAYDADTAKTYHRFDGVIGGRTLGVFAVDLRPESLFSLKVDGLEQKTCSSDSNGVVQTSINLTEGVHNIELLLDEAFVNRKQSEQDVKIYPNPASHYLCFELKPDLKASSIAFYSAEGKCLRTFPFRKTIDVAQWPAALYIVEIKTEQGIYRRRFVKGKI